MSITTIDTIERNNGKTTNKGNSGTFGVGVIVLVGDCVGLGEAETELAGIVNVCMLLQSLD